MNKRGKSVLLSSLILILLTLFIAPAILSSESDSSSSQTSSNSDSSSSSSSTKTIIKEREIIRLIPKDKESEEGKAEDDGVIKLGDKTSITGATIGANLLSGSSLIIIITMLCVTFIIFLIVTSRTILRLKGK